MEQNQAKAELEKLIRFAHESREQLKRNHPMVIVWHITLGISFILSGVNINSSFDNSVSRKLDYLYVKPYWIFVFFVGLAWVVTAVYLKMANAKPEKVSSLKNKFVAVWLKEAVILSIVGFCALIDNGIFSIYPFVFGIIMGNLLMVYKLLFDLKRMDFIAAIWFVGSVASLFFDVHTRYYIIGVICFVPPALFCVRNFFERS